MPVDSVPKITNYQLEPMAEASNREKKEERSQNKKEKKSEKPSRNDNFQNILNTVAQNEEGFVDIYRQNTDTINLIKLLMARPNPALFQNKILMTYLAEKTTAKNSVKK